MAEILSKIDKVDASGKIKVSKTKNDEEKNLLISNQKGISTNKTKSEKSLKKEPKIKQKAKNYDKNGTRDPKKIGKAEEKIKKGNKYKYDEVILSVTVHHMDRTEGLPILISHPVVEVFILEANEGTLLKKSSRKRKVTSFYEDEHVTEILPLMTQPFNIQEKKSLFCQWEEQLIFNESLNYMKEYESDIIFFFHLKDFGAFKTNKSIKKKTSVTTDWKTFAWAFLKFSSRTGLENIGVRLRLQLYRPRKLLNVKFTDIYSWWKSGSRRKYESSLHITAQGTTLPSNPVPSLRSVFPNQMEHSISYYSGSQQELTAKVDIHGSVTTLPINKVEWDRKDNEVCQIPNSIVFQFSSLGQGSMVVKFSNNGLFLACGTHHDILVYDVISGVLSYCLRGHLGIVYSLEWSANDNHLLSSSADATVRVWNFQENSKYYKYVLTHPSYVYSAKFIPGGHNIIVSGCFDHILRVWMLEENKYVIIQDLNVHLSYVTSIIFDPDGKFMYSADKQGSVAKWEVNILKKRKGNVANIEFLELMNLEDIRGISVSHLIFHPNKYRILIQTKDSCIRLVNTNTKATTQKLQGILNTKDFIKCCISPCGNWVISGSEDGSLAVWDSETGILFTVMFDLPFETTISCVDFHPHNHMTAVCSYSEHTTILLMKFDDTKSSNGKAVPKAVQSTMSSNKYNMSIETFNQKRTIPNKELLLNCESSPSTEHWKDVGKNLLMKLDFILKAANDGSELPEKSAKLREKKDVKIYEAEALYSYKSTAADEANLQKGEHVQVVKETNSDWWCIEKENGQRGLVPASYVKYLPLAARNKVKRVKEDNGFEKLLVRQMSLKEMTKAPSIVKVARIRRQRSRSEDSLSFLKSRSSNFKMMTE